MKVSFVDWYALNPLIGREFVATLRLRRTSILLVLVALAASTFVLIQWPTDLTVDLSGNQTRRVFSVFAYGMLAVVGLISPVFAATSIVREKNAGTLALLFNTPMTPWGIYVGKLVGSVAFLGLVLLASAPAAAALTAMGGVSFGAELGPLYLLMAVAAVQFVCIALWVSSRSSTTDSALRWSYAAVLAVTVLAVLPHMFLQGLGTRWAWAAAYLRCVSPIPPLMELVGHGEVAGMGFRTVLPALPYYPWFALAVMVACSGATVWRLNYRILDRPRPQGIMTHERSRAAQWLRRLFFIVDPQRRTAHIPRWVNPILVKEFRCRRFGRAYWLLRLVAVSAVVSLLLTYAAATATIARGVATIGGILVGLQAALVVLLTPSLTATLISGERESGGWVLLQMTPISALRILTGKLFSVLWTLLLVVIATLPGYLILVWINPDFWLQVRMVIISLMWTALFSIAVSATISSYFRRTAPSTVVSYVVLLTLYAGTLLIWLGRDAPFGHDLVENALRLNSLAAALSIIGTPGFHAYRLIPDAWNITGVATVVLLVVLYSRICYLMKPG